MWTKFFLCGWAGEDTARALLAFPPECFTWPLAKPTTATLAYALCHCRFLGYTSLAARGRSATYQPRLVWAGFGRIAAIPAPDGQPSCHCSSYEGAEFIAFLERRDALVPREPLGV